MEFSFMLKVNDSKEKIWEYYKNIERWYIWEENLEDISLSGEFKSGSKGFMKLKGMPKMEFELVSVIRNKEFTDMTIMPFGSLYFSHEILEKEGDIYIKHSVYLKNAKDTLDNIEFLINVFRDVPKSMFLIRESIDKN